MCAAAEVRDVGAKASPYAWSSLNPYLSVVLTLLATNPVVIFFGWVSRGDEWTGTFSGCGGQAEVRKEEAWSGRRARFSSRGIGRVGKTVVPRSRFSEIERHCALPVIMELDGLSKNPTSQLRVLCRTSHPTSAPTCITESRRRREIT